MDAVKALMERNEQLVRDNMRLQRKLGRCAYWRNQFRKERDELAEENGKLRKAHDNTCAELGRMADKYYELRRGVDTEECRREAEQGNGGMHPGRTPVPERPLETL